MDLSIFGAVSRIDSAVASASRSARTEAARRQKRAEGQNSTHATGPRRPHGHEILPALMASRADADGFRDASATGGGVPRSGATKQVRARPCALPTEAPARCTGGRRFIPTRPGGRPIDHQRCVCVPSSWPSSGPRCGQVRWLPSRPLSSGRPRPEHGGVHQFEGLQQCHPAVARARRVALAQRHGAGAPHAPVGTRERMVLNRRAFRYRQAAR